MAFNYSGIKKVEYDTAGNSFASAVDLGTILADSPGVSFEPQEAETAKGTSLYAGTKKEHTFHCEDMTKYSALETIMKADTEVDVRATDVEGNVETIALNATVKVKKVYGSQTGSKNYFEVKFTTFAI